MDEKIGNEAISRGVGESERGKVGGSDGVKFISEDATCGLNCPPSNGSFLLSAGDAALGNGGFLNGMPDAWACAPWSILSKMNAFPPCKSGQHRKKEPVRPGFCWGDSDRVRLGGALL